MHYGVKKSTSTPFDTASSQNVRSSQRNRLPRETGQAALERIIQENEKESERWNRFHNLSSREFAEQLKKDQASEQKENQIELQRLLALAQGFQQLSDLTDSITEALSVQNDDTLQALFLCLYQRNPDQAFEELSLRPEWSYSLSPASWMLIENKQLLKQLSLKNRNQDFKDVLADSLANKIATADDLPTLVEAMTILDESSTDMFLHSFSGAWLPENPEASAQFIFQEIPPELRSELLDQLFQRQVFGGSGPSWSFDLGNAMLQYKTQISPEITKLIEESVLAATAKPSPSMPETPDSERLQISSSDDDSIAWTLSAAVSTALHHDKDYPELLIQGQVSMEEIAEHLQEQIEGEEKHSELFMHLLYQQLAPHAPEVAHHWAMENLKDKDSALRSSLTVIADMKNEPRNRRALQVARHLYPSYPSPDIDLTAGLLPISKWTRSWKELAPAEYSTFIITQPHNSALEQQLQNLTQKSSTP